MKKVISLIMTILLFASIFSACGYSNSSGAHKTITLTKDNFEQYFSISYSYSDLEESQPLGLPTARAVFEVRITPKTNIVSADNVVVEIRIADGVQWKTLSDSNTESVYLDSNGYCNASINVKGKMAIESTLINSSRVSDVSGTITI